MARRLLGRLLAAAALLVLAAQPSAGQAFIPAPGDGSISLSFQSVRTSGQLDGNGEEIFRGATDAQALICHVEYGVTDKIAVHAALPLIMARYNGEARHDVGLDLQPTDIDDGTYHGSFQDFYVGARYGIVQSPRFALAPFVEVIIPSHHYESVGQAAVGRDLRAVLVGAAAGGFLDDIVPGLYFQTRVSYAIAQDLLDVRTNRTGIDSAIGYFVSPRLAIQFVETFQHFHDGIDFYAGPPFTASIHSGVPVTAEHGLNHDRLMRSRVLSLGGGVNYAFTESVGLFATATTMAWGKSLQRPERALTVGMSWGFHTGRASSRPSPNVTRPVRLP